MTRLTFAISSCGAIIIVAALLFLSSDTQSNEGVRDSDREGTSPRQRLQNPVAGVEAIRAAMQQPVQDESSTPPPLANAAQLTQQMAELSDAVARLEQTVQNLEGRLSRSIRSLPTGDKTEAGLAGKKAELDAQAKRSRAASVELQRFAARFGVTLDERVLTDPTFPAPLDSQPKFVELRAAATNSLRVLQAVERRFAADVLDRASFQ